MNGHALAPMIPGGQQLLAAVGINGSQETVGGLAPRGENPGQRVDSSTEGTGFVLFLATLFTPEAGPHSIPGTVVNPGGLLDGGSEESAGNGGSAIRVGRGETGLAQGLPLRRGVPRTNSSAAVGRQGTLLSPTVPSPPGQRSASLAGGRQSAGTSPLPPAVGGDRPHDGSGLAAPALPPANATHPGLLAVSPAGTPRAIPQVPAESAPQSQARMTLGGDRFESSAAASDHLGFSNEGLGERAPGLIPAGLAQAKGPESWGVRMSAPATEPAPAPAAGPALAGAPATAAEPVATPAPPLSTPVESGFQSPTSFSNPGHLVADHSGPLPDLEPSDLGPLAVESAATGSSFLKGGDVLVQGGGGSGSSSILETMNPSQLSERIRELLRTKGPGRVEVKLRLDPPELGTVRLRLVATGDSVTVQLLARTHEAVEALERRLPELAQALAQNGTHLSEAWVGLDDTGDERRRSGAAEGDREKRLSGTSRGRRRDQDQADDSDPVRPVVGPGARLDVIA